MITKQKGTYDLYGDKANAYLYIRSMIESIMSTYNYEYMQTPTFEASNLFHRSVGNTTDIVTKETYDFKDRGDRNITLRPEGTAGIVRSFIENKLYANDRVPKKLWYLENMFRYERPQSGRYREFLQFGCEAFGSDDPMLDAELISIPVLLFEMLGLKKVKVRINSLGDVDTRENYKKALMEYFAPHIKDLCEDCQARFSKNPLRILDCKVDKDNPILKNAPKILDYLNTESQAHFDAVLKYLEALDIDYEVDSRVIRGLDYYTHAVFEIEAEIEGFGSQNVICAGGRYDNLVGDLEGPDTKAVGFAIGLERLMLALEKENIAIPDNNYLDVYLIYLGEEAKEKAFAINHMLRIMGFKSDIDYNNRTIKANFKQAERLNASFAIIIGEDELKNNYLTVRNMQTKEEEQVKNKDLTSYLDAKLSQEEDSCSCDDCNHDEEHCKHDECHYNKCE